LHATLISQMNCSKPETESSDRRLGGDPPTSAMTRIYHRFLDFLGLLCGLLVLALMLGVSVDVLVRSVRGRPILWMFEVTEYVLLYIPCLGMAWLAREYGHVAITSFVGKLPAKPRLLLAVATMLFCAFVCLVVAYWGVWATYNSVARRSVAGMMLRIPEYALLWVVPFGFGLAAIEFLRLAVTGPIPPAEAGRH
jgi:C4-dicarboxylate transporter, DctQ subunit